jgi:LPS export ABC transporter protein LptC
MNSLIFRVIFVLFGVVFVFSCRESVGPESIPLYDGPINEAIDIVLIHSDSAILRSEIRAPKQLEFKNGNLEFPEGIEIKFFTVTGILETTMRADRGFFIQNENLYRGEGNVQIQNLIKDQKLQTEEIFWNQAQKKIWTEKFVTIQERQTLFNGTGMEADDSFSNYTLKQVRDSRTLLPGEGL